VTVLAAARSAKALLIGSDSEETSSIGRRSTAKLLARSKVSQAARDRAKLVRSDPDVEHRADVNEFMLGWYCRAERKPVGLYLPSQGSAVWVERWQYAGNRTAVTMARVVESSISYVAIDDLGSEQLSLVVLKVLRDCIAAAPANAGIGGAVQLAVVTARGVRVLAPDELRAANDALDVWQERSAELLPGATDRPATGPVDRGLKPPQ
jgi:hypothetical protein